MGKKEKKLRLTPPVMGEGCTLVDTHCHLDMAPYLDDLDAVLQRAESMGVEKVVTIGIDRASSEAALDIATRYDNVYATIGVHPHHAEETRSDDYLALAELSRHAKVVGYGEIGLDTVKDYAPYSVQKEHFLHQAHLAKELNLPLIVHDREAHEDILRLLKDAGPFEQRGIMHCYSGDTDLALQLIDLGFFISIPGVVTFNKAEQLQDAVRNIALEYLLIETDGPFLAPVPWRGKRNEPGYVVYTAARIAELKSLSLDEVAGSTTANAGKVFGWS